jgi:hypothetical protein
VKAIITSVPWHALRAGWAREIAAQFDDAEIVWDETHDAYDTFVSALKVQGGVDVWHFQDDAIMASRWLPRASWEMQSHPGAILHGFGRVKQDLDLGSRWMRGRNFMGGVCWFLPGYFAPDLLGYALTWERPENVRGWVDVMVANWMADRKLRFWRIVPSLVQHRDGESVIGGAGRTRHRQSPTFVP